MRENLPSSVVLVAGGARGQLGDIGGILELPSDCISRSKFESVSHTQMDEEQELSHRTCSPASYAYPKKSSLWKHFCGQRMSAE